MNEKTTIFIDTQDMEERYGEELYKEYLEKENQQLKKENEKLNHYKLLYQKVKEKNDKAVEYMKLNFMNRIDIDGGERYFADYEIHELYEILEGNNESK